MRKAIPLLLLLIFVFLLSSCEYGEDEVIHTVTLYDGFGGTSVQYIADGKKAVKPYRNPVAPEGCMKGEFRFWVTKGDNGLETEYDFSGSVKEDLSLFAVYWDSVTVYFYDSDNTLLGTESVSADTFFRITKPSDPVSKRGDEGKFKCWTLFGSTEEWDFNTSISASVNLYARYHDLHCVTYYSDGDYYASELVSDGDRAFGPEKDPVSSGKGSLLGWSTGNDGGEESAWDFTESVTEDMSLYAFYRDARYVTLLDSDESEIEKIKVDFLSLLPVPERTETENGIIKKWQKKNDDGTYSDYDFTLPVENNITLKAVCYDEVNTEGEEKEILSMMRFGEVLSSCTGDREGDDTISGFTETELALLFLLGSKSGIDEATLRACYTDGSTPYFLYDPEKDLTAPDSILYLNMENAGCTRYVSSREGSQTRITATDLKIEASPAPGKIENGAVVKNGDYFESSSITLIFSKITLAKDEDGNFVIEIVDNDGTTRVLTAENIESGTGTVKRLIYTDEDTGSTTESAFDVSFCTVTFDYRNGSPAEEVRIRKGENVEMPDETPLDAYGSSSTFRFWSLDGGMEYDFSSPVSEDITLKAVYTTQDEFRVLLEAECIYRMVRVFESYPELFNGNTSVDAIFTSSSSSDSDYDLASLLLGSLFSVNSNEKLCFTYGGKEYVFDGNELSYQIYRLTPSMSIGKNTSSKSGSTTRINIENITIALQAKYFEGGTRKWFMDSLTNTFSLDAVITEESSGAKTTAVTLKTGEKTYSGLTVKSTPADGGKEEAVFTYKNRTFTRFY